MFRPDSTFHLNKRTVPVEREYSALSIMTAGRSFQRAIFLSLFLLSYSKHSRIFESSFTLTPFGTVFQAHPPNVILDTILNTRSLMRCLMQCNQNLHCCTVNYDQSSRSCQLFEGELSAGTVIADASFPLTRVGAVRFNTESVSQSYGSYNQTCDHCAAGSNRYVQCSSGTCQCPSKTFWNGQMCRKDLNFTCSNQIHSCISTSICHTFTFTSVPKLFNTGSGPTSIISADFNRDGHADVAVTCYNDKSVTILLGLGDGSFQSIPWNVSSNGVNPFRLVCDDFNQDGYLDLAMSNEGSNTITVLVAWSNGSLGFTSNTYASGGSLPSSLIAVDVNNDAQTDLVVANTGSDNVVIFLGTGNGTFGVCRVYATGDGPSSITHGDFNHDMKVDLAVVNRHANQLQIFVGLGDGSFISSATNYSTESLPYNVRTSDLNGDGNLDLVVANMDSDSIGIHLGTGQGTFYRPSPATYPTGGSGALGLSIVDLNRDSQMDLVVGNQFSNDITVFFGNGNGTFRQNLTFSLPGMKLQGLVVVDFNEDGNNDIAAVSETNNTVAVLLAKCT